MRAFLAVLFLVAGCSETAPSATALGIPVESADPRAPGVADVRTPRDLLPERLDPPWELVAEPQLSQIQYSRWAIEMEIAVVFEAALAVARWNEEKTVAIIVFQSDSGIDGQSFAQSWIRAYACDEPRASAIAGVAVTAVHAQVNCRPTYLLVFRDQLVVIEDASESDREDLEPAELEPVVRAIMEQAR